MTLGLVYTGVGGDLFEVAHPRAFLGAVLCMKPREYISFCQMFRFYPRTWGLKI